MNKKVRRQHNTSSSNFWFNFTDLLNNLKDNLRTVDRVLLILILAFLTFGLLIIYDATAILAQELYGIAYRFVLLQFGWILLGSIGFFFFSSVDLERLRKFATPLFFTSIGILSVLALFGVLPCSTNFIFAPCINGANRWFYLNPPPLPALPLLGVLGFQPSEFAKLSLVIFLSAVLSKKNAFRDSSPFGGYLIITGLVSGLVLLQPNLSTALLLFAIATSIYFASDYDLKPLLVSAPITTILGIIFMFSSSYRRDRLLTFLSIGDSTAELEKGYHIRQILIALGSGGAFGVGFGHSRQKFQYLPEVFADSIFAIIGEELGFVGTTLLVILFGALIHKGYSIAKNSETVFGRLLAVGVTTWVALQFFVNVGAMTKLIPLTGIPLPLISYGGSSLVFILSGLGLLANVSKMTSRIPLASTTDSKNSKFHLNHLSNKRSRITSIVSTKKKTSTSHIGGKFKSKAGSLGPTIKTKKISKNINNNTLSKKKRAS